MGFSPDHRTLLPWYRSVKLRHHFIDTATNQVKHDCPPYAPLAVHRTRPSSHRMARKAWVTVRGEDYRRCAQDGR